jgi:hypothetical protein
MFNKTLTAVAVATAVAAAAPAPAHASWFDTAGKCQSIEDVFRGIIRSNRLPSSLPIPQTPDEVIRFLGAAKVHDTTTAYSRDLNPEVVRVLDFGGPHGSHLFVTDQRVCFEAAAHFQANAAQFSR